MTDIKITQSVPLTLDIPGINRISGTDNRETVDSYNPSNTEIHRTKGALSDKDAMKSCVYASITSNPAVLSPAVTSGQTQVNAADTPPSWISPWGELVQEGRAKGELDKALTPELRGKLESALMDLQKQGVRFSKDKGSIFKSSTRISLSPQKVVDHLAGCRAHHLDNLYVQVPGFAEFCPEGIGQLAAVGQFVLGPPDALRASLEGLAGVGFDKDLLQSYCKAFGSEYLDIQFYRGGQQKFNSDNLETYCARGVDQILAVNALTGNGSTAGVKNLDLVRRLSEAIKLEYLKNTDALHIYADNEGLIPLKVDSKLPPMLAPEAMLDDAAAATKAANTYKSAYERTLLPVVAAAGYGTTYSFHEEVHRPDGAIPIEARIESFAIMASSGGLGNDVQELHKKLLSQSANGSDAIRRAMAIAPALKKDIEGAEKLLEELSKIKQNPNTELYEELRAGTGSHSVAQAGVNLVKIPSHCEGKGAENIDVRKGAYVRLAKTLPDDSREHTPEVYQTLLINRRADEPLAQACDRFCTLITTCTLIGYPMLAPALYEILQQGPAEGMDERIIAFGKSVAAGGSLPDALSQLDDRAASAIQVEDDHVIVGGIILKRHQ